MFGLIRTITGLIFAIICSLAVRKSKIKNKRKWGLLISLFTIILVTASAFYPIENSVITFSSPEKAYVYFYSYETELTVSGNETDFVSGSNHGTRSFLILPKTEKGWKISTGNDLKIVCKKRIDGITVATIYKHRNYDDLYVVISMVEGGQNKIGDNVGSEFYSKKYTDSEKYFEDYYMYVAHIAKSDKPYCITVNGKEILLSDSKQ